MLTLTLALTLGGQGAQGLRSRRTSVSESRVCEHPEVRRRVKSCGTEGGAAHCCRKAREKPSGARLVYLILNYAWAWIERVMHGVMTAYGTAARTASPASLGTAGLSSRLAEDASCVCPFVVSFVKKILFEFIFVWS